MFWSCLVALILFLSNLACEQGHLGSSENQSIPSVASLDLENTGAIFVEVTPLTLDPKNKLGPLVRTAGTFVDIGSSQYFGVVLPLANFLFPLDGQSKSYLPIMRSVDLKIWYQKDKPPLELKKISMDLGGKLSYSLRFAAVGLRLEKSVDAAKASHRIVQSLVPEALLNQAISKLVSDGKVEVQGRGINLRNNLTGYLLALVPRDLNQDLKSLRPPSLGEARSPGELFVSIPSLEPAFKEQILKTQIMFKSPLGLDLEKQPNLQDSFLEVNGAGICRTEQRGAALLKKGSDQKLEFLGFLAASTALAQNFRGSLVACDKVASKEAYSLAVLPSKSEWKKLLERGD